MMDPGCQCSRCCLDRACSLALSKDTWLRHSEWVDEESLEETARLCKIFFKRSWMDASPVLRQSLVRWRKIAWRVEKYKPRTRAWYRRRVRAEGVMCLWSRRGHTSCTTDEACMCAAPVL